MDTRLLLLALPESAREPLCRGLETCGCAWETADTWEAAEKFQRAGDCVAVIAALSAPDVAAVAARARALDVPVIWLAADAPGAARAEPEGEYEFLDRLPPAPEELRRIIARARERRRLLRELREKERMLAEMDGRLQRLNAGREQEIAAHTQALSEANRNLKSLDQMKNNLLANVSHELRTPLVSVRGYIDLFQQGLLGEMPDGAEKYLATCMRNIDRQLALIDNLVNYAETVRGEVGLRVETLDLCGCFRAAAEAAARAAEKAGVTLRLNLAAEKIEVAADRRRLEQALAEIVGNAVKFNPAGTAVTLRLELVSGRRLVRAAVEDNGIGIAEEHLPHIFDRFYQCDASHTRRHGGTGLGLAIARDDLRLLGSELRVSSAPGRTVFYWNMPVAGEPLGKEQQC